MAMKDEILAETKKIKDMTPKQKWEYFLEYYKWWAIGIVVGIICLISMIKDIVNSRQDAFYMVMINAGMDAVYEDPTKEWANELELTLGINQKKYQVSIDPNLTLTNNMDSQMDYSSMEKIMALAGARSLDVMVANTAIFEFYAQSDFYYKLEDILTPEQYERLKPYFYYTDEATKAKEDVNTFAEQTKLKEQKLALTIDHNDPSTMKEPVAVGIYTKYSDKMNSQGCYEYAQYAEYQGYPEAGVFAIALSAYNLDYARACVDYFFP